MSSDGCSARKAESAGITCSRSTIPFDPRPPMYSSGVRLGTPALTTLGLGRTEMDQIADIIHATLGATEPAPTPSGRSRARYRLDADVADAGRIRSAELLDRFPLYPDIQL